MALAVAIYRVSNESSESFVQGRLAVQIALNALDIPKDNWLSSEVTHNEENDYVDVVITYDDAGPQ